MASTSDDTTNAPIAGVDTSSAPMSARERKKREVEEKMKANKRAKEDRETALRDARLTQSDGRIAERTVIKNSIALGAYTISTPPTLQLLVKTLGMLQGLLLSQEWVRRRQDGILNLTAFQRADPVGALARAANDEGDVREAALKMLAIIQVLYDYVTARTGDASQIAEGREASRDPEERNREAPAWSAADGGYTRLNFGIDEAASPEGVQAFHDWGKSATQEDIDAAARRPRRRRRRSPEAPARIPNVRDHVPGGGRRRQPPRLRCGAGAQEQVGAHAHRHRRRCAADPRGPRWPSASRPTRSGPSPSSSRRWRRRGGPRRASRIIASTLGASLGRNGRPGRDHPQDFATRPTSSSTRTRRRRTSTPSSRGRSTRSPMGRAIISVHDEADTLTKKQLDPDAPPTAKVPAIQRLWPYFSLSKARTILVGATLIPTLEDDSLMGSILHDGPARRGRRSLRRGHPDPAARADRPGAAVHRHRALRGGAVRRGGPGNNPFAFTQKLVLAKMKRMRGPAASCSGRAPRPSCTLAQNKPVVPLIARRGGGHAWRPRGRRRRVRTPPWAASRRRWTR